MTNFNLCSEQEHPFKPELPPKKKNQNPGEGGTAKQWLDWHTREWNSKLPATKADVSALFGQMKDVKGLLNEILEKLKSTAPASSVYS